MDRATLNQRIAVRGRELFVLASGEKVSLFDTQVWTGKVLDWSMRNSRFKTQLFRFVDTFPSLTTSRQLTDHIRQYFGQEQDMPPVLATGAHLAGRFGSLGGTVLSRLIAANIQQMAHQFIVGETTDEAIRGITRLRRVGFAAVVDVLGEATLTAEEAEEYVASYLGLLDGLDRAQHGWTSLPGQGAEPQRDWGSAPRLNVSVKPTALFALASPQDFEGSVAAILAQLGRIAERVVQANGFLCIDMETYRHKEITLEVYRRLKQKYRDYPHLGVVLQAYLHDTERDLEGLLDWARTSGTTISVRLVKGAYWDYETVRAQQNGWPVPVRSFKAETDAAFERLAGTILANHQLCHFACGSHNIRSIAAVMEMARDLGVPEERYEFQVLYGMAEPIRRAILKSAGRLRLYCPYGPMIPGMGYLVRRLLENTANESFLRRSFVEQDEIERLLEDPAVTVERERARTARPQGNEKDSGTLPPFANEPAADFTQPELRAAFPRAIAGVRDQRDRIYPLFIDGHEIRTEERLASTNPAAPDEVLGWVCQAGPVEAEQAIAAASKAFPSWRATSPRQRAEFLLRGAAAARRRIVDLAAWQVLEIGKQWDQAYADVAEAIDFLEYYAREMCRLAEPQRLGRVPGESNLLVYEPRGVAVVIAPWNFPLAISMGMVSAAVVTGNPVVFKPSSLTCIVGWQLVEIFREAGLPVGVFNYLPGRSGTIGDLLVDHCDVALIAFTGSMEVGLRINERAALVQPGQAQVKRVVLEMGGKNAIIVDDDADLDEAVPQVLMSTFGFQGQKCSACSRVIVVEGIYERFVERLVKAARVWRIGPAEDPAFSMGAVCEAAARDRVLEYIEIGRQEGRLLYQSPVPEGDGFWVPLTIIGDIQPQHRLAQEEIFGPVLAVMRVRDFDQALGWANHSRFALTGGIFSRSPEHLERAAAEFRVGNLYLNRGITGALVGRQPFGGTRMSGGGTKAGGPDYLLHFMDARAVTENTMRRGFTPVEELRDRA